MVARSVQDDTEPTIFTSEPNVTDLRVSMEDIKVPLGSSWSNRSSEGIPVNDDVFHRSGFECDYCARKLPLDAFYKWIDGKYYCEHHSPQLCAIIEEEWKEEKKHPYRNIEAAFELYRLADQDAPTEIKRQTGEEAGKAADKEAHCTIGMPRQQDQNNLTKQNPINSAIEKKICEETIISDKPSEEQQDNDEYYDLECMTLDLVNVLPIAKSQRLLELLGAREGRVTDLEVEREGLREEVNLLRGEVQKRRPPNLLSRDLAKCRERMRTSALMVPLLMCLACVSSLLVVLKMSKLVQRAACSLPQDSEHNIAEVNSANEPLGDLRQWLCASVRAAEQAEREAEQEVLMNQWIEAEKVSEAMVTKLRLDRLERLHVLGSLRDIAGILGALHVLAWWPRSV